MDRPFAILEQWIREGRIHVAPAPVAEEPRDFPLEEMPPGLTDEELFEFAMRNVKSLGWSAD